MGHVIVVDLGFGDAGKGTVVDHLCAASPVGAVVRFNGGAQAAHNVVTADGRHHTFAQFGSGTFTPGVRTHLSRFMLVDPLALAAEADHLRTAGVPDALDRLTVDRDALLTTPYHRAANRARESARGADRHGSCGMGIGETASYALAHDDAPRAGDCLSPARLRRRLTAVRDWYRAAFPRGEAVPEVEACADAFTAFGERVAIVGGEHLRGLLRAGNVVFEGAQGVLLDEWHGFHPYTTWSTTTFANAETLLAEAGESAYRLGVLRAYATRHGPGPFVTEDPVLTADLPDRHNGSGRWQGAFRVGHLDAVALRYALGAAGGADGLAVTHLDVAGACPDLRACVAYETDGGRVERLPAGPPDLDRQAALTRRLLRARPVYAPLGRPVETIEGLLRTPVVLRSHGPAPGDKIPGHLRTPIDRGGSRDQDLDQRRGSPGGGRCVSPSAASRPSRRSPRPSRS
ncbi:adenylosuccinate synthetase [Actinomadura livida]|uniref:Adenylosuccinate synthetase n=1 Tax=Actinomadura livida TaxID=79909 RepID=A0A7W7IGC0_9ACTN|nr:MULTISPECIES: adenylosuccinate synthetase [Actinomadura]MBB4776593.1 adenylosuccinate synthase [Actinomadura catellatispora]GGT93413.1 adenylosuccinate synthetase [Actinomadura livida]